MPALLRTHAPVKTQAHEPLPRPCRGGGHPTGDTDRYREKSPPRTSERRRDRTETLHTASVSGRTIPVPGNLVFDGLITRSVAPFDGAAGAGNDQPSHRSSSSAHRPYTNRPTHLAE